MLKQLHQALVTTSHPFNVEVNEIHCSNQKEARVTFFTNFEISKMDAIIGKGSFEEVVRAFNSKIEETIAFKSMESNLLSQINTLEDNIEDHLKEIERLREYETFYKLLKELKCAEIIDPLKFNGNPDSRPDHCERGEGLRG